MTERCPSRLRRVAYLGPPGTNGEIAARELTPGEHHLPQPSHAAVAAAVERSEADVGVVAIENSINGSVAETLDILIHDTQLRIQAEAVIPIRHQLAITPGADLAAIEVVYSHPQALGQCREYLARVLPQARLVASLSTAESVRIALEHGPTAAAISSERAVELFGAAIGARDIQDAQHNATRFVLLGREAVPPTGHDRTSIAFTFGGDTPGMLVSVLQEFASRGINCSKMESRPTKAAFGEYVFLLDFHGHEAEPETAAVLDAVRGHCSWVKIFGSYPRWA